MADLGSEEDERTVELASIAAIFPELIFDPLDPFTAKLDLPVSPAKPLAVKFLSTAAATVLTGLPTPPTSHGPDETGVQAEQPGQDAATVHSLSHLPPLSLTLTLPENYPAEESPIIHLESQSSWLPDSRLKVLTTASNKIWKDLGQDQVVYTYIDHLQQEAENGFGLNSMSEPVLTLPSELEIPLLDFDLKAKWAKFEKETFECGVCLEPKKGLVCHRLLLCGHVFCVSCLQDFYNSCITEGDVASVKCLTPNCGKEDAQLGPVLPPTRKRKRKADRTLDPSELLQIPIDQDMVQRYVKLKRKKLLESDRTTVYCPRQWCQGPARSKKTVNPNGSSDSEDEEEPQTYDPNINQDKLPPPAERLAICEDCSFAFCKVCKASWHGEYVVCFPRKQHELTAEEKASEAYLTAHSTACPTCDARVQKTMGCNHMICSKCNSHFCYLCSAWLAEDNPYQHFNTEWMPCYMRLWELEDGDGDEADRERVRNNPVDPVVQFIADEAEEDQHVLPHPFPPAPPAAPAAPAAPAEGPWAVRVNRRVQAGLARPRQPVQAPGRHPPMQGLQRFLELAQNDEEEEWDSDELDEDDDEDEQEDRWVIPIR